MHWVKTVVLSLFVISTLGCAAPLSSRSEESLGQKHAQLYYDQVERTVVKLRGVPHYDEDLGRFIAGLCSGVIIAPDRVMTAAHCVLDEEGYGSADRVETRHGTFKVQGGKVDSEHDIAVLYVPGVRCPCAKVDTLDAQPGEKVAVIGYPAGNYVPRIDTEVLRIETLMQAVRRYISPHVPERPGVHRRFVWTDPVLIGGHSGGGMFAYRDGEWRLVAINSLNLFFPFAGNLVSGYVPVGEMD